MEKRIKPAITSPQYLVDTDVTFAQVDDWFGHTSMDLKLDIIYPENPGHPYPCIVWICGGGWKQMDKSAHLYYLSYLASKGFVVASLQYRTSNLARFPAQLEDIKAGIRFLKSRSKRYNIDTNKFGIMGESAGGHLAAMAGLTGKITEFDKGDHMEFSSAVQAVCTWYLPSKLDKVQSRDSEYSPETETEQEELEEFIYGQSSSESLLIGKNARLCRDLAAAASPVNYVTKEAPPFLIFHGTRDSIVPYSQSKLMYDLLQEKGINADFISVEGADHADLHFFQKETWDLIVEFFTGIFI